MINNDEQLNIEEELPEDAYVEEQVAESDAPAPRRKRSKSEIVINVALWIAIVLLLVAVVMRLFVFSTVEVSGVSMNPTYDSGEIVTVNKVKGISRGDVVVFYKNEVDDKFKAQFAKPEECAEGKPYEKLIKRVVALEGDKIWLTRIAENANDVVYKVVIDTADGNRLYEDYYVKKGAALTLETYYLHTNMGFSGLGNLENCTETNPFVVSKGCFFAMGDNRLNSKDSRFFGEFKQTQLYGVVLDK